MTFHDISISAKKKKITKNIFGTKVLIREAPFLFRQLVPNSPFEKITLTEGLNQGYLKVNREEVVGGLKFPSTNLS